MKPLPPPPSPQQAQAMSEAIRANNIDRVRALAEENPLLLIWPDQRSTPLSCAVFRSALAMVEVILEGIQAHPELAQARLPKGFAMLQGNPYYVYELPVVEGSFTSDSPLPHTSCLHRKLFELLHRYGYDLNVSTSRQEDDCLLYNLMERTFMGSSSLELLESAVKSGLKINRPYPHRHDWQAHPGTRYLLTCSRKLLGDSGDQDASPGEKHALLQEQIFLAKLGLDLRLQHAPGDFMDRILAMGTGGGGEILRTNFTHLRQQFLAFCATRPAAFLAAETEEPRQEALLASCAGGTLPALLHRCVATQDEETYHDIRARMDEYWKSEYAHSFRTAEATLARTAPVAQSALAAWAKG